jgi:hypothetical protein
MKKKLKHFLRQFFPPPLYTPDPLNGDYSNFPEIASNAVTETTIASNSIREIGNDE